MPVNIPTRASHAGWHGRSRRANWPAIGAIAGLHLIGLFALMQIDAVRETVAEAAPIFVSFISAAPVPQPKPPEPKPQIVEKPKPAPRLIAHETPAPADLAIAPTKAEPEKEAPPPPAAAAPATPEPPAVIPPNYAAGYLDNPRPIYSPVSRNLGESGRVLLRVLVNPEGLPEQVEIEQSSGYDRLDKSALDGVHRWRFVPAKQGTQAVAAWVLIPINFDLSR